jgi:Icc-related predicted phosphoesterase
MKILYTTYLHGNQTKYDQIFDIARKNKVDVVVNGGDMLPKNIDLFKQDDFIVRYLGKYFLKFNQEGIYYLSYLGNDDLKIFDQLFNDTCEKYDFVYNIAQKKVEINGYEFIGMNWVVDYPFRLKDRCRKDTKDYNFQVQFGTGLLSTDNGFKEINNWVEYANTLPTIEEELSNLPEPCAINKSIYVIHMPPCGLGLDQCINGQKVGSKAVYEFLLNKKPLISFHGHIHESPSVTLTWKNNIDRTICIQPGQMNKLTYVLIDFNNMKIKRIEI